MEKVKKNSSALLPHVIPVRVSESKHRELQSLLSSSRCRSMSELVRKIIDNRKIIVETQEITGREISEELAQVRKEIHAIGVNINQVTRRFHTEKLPEQRLIQVMDIARLFQQTDQKVSQLFTIMAKLPDLWLQK